MSKSFSKPTSPKIMKVNIGPQHPSTHGVLRLVMELEGEIIKSCEPVVGYLHRGMEKMAENRTYLQYAPTVDRIDYLSGFFNSYVYCDAVEKLASIEISERSKYIRILMLELDRLASHLLWLGTFMLDMGATSPLFYTFRDREVILSLFESLTGQRLMYNYFLFGGVKLDVSDDWLKEVNNLMKAMPAKINDYEYIITNNPIFVTRTKNIGVLSKNVASQFSITGPNLRASGVALDFRKNMDIYNQIEFSVISEQDGDSLSRYLVRVKEMRECIKIIEQCVDWLRANPGDVSTKIKPAVLKVPEGEYISSVEAPRGLTCCYIKSDGTAKPYRVKWRTGSYYAVQLLPVLLGGSYYADLMAIFGSLDVILPEVDK